MKGGAILYSKALAAGVNERGEKFEAWPLIRRDLDALASAVRAEAKRTAEAAIAGWKRQGRWFAADAGKGGAK